MNNRYGVLVFIVLMIYVHYYKVSNITDYPSVIRRPADGLVPLVIIIYYAKILHDYTYNRKMVVVYYNNI